MIFFCRKLHKKKEKVLRYKEVYNIVKGTKLSFDSLKIKKVSSENVFVLEMCVFIYTNLGAMIPVIKFWKGVAWKN